MSVRQVDSAFDSVRPTPSQEQGAYTLFFSFRWSSSASHGANVDVTTSLRPERKRERPPHQPQFILREV